MYIYSLKRVIWQLLQSEWGKAALLCQKICFLLWDVGEMTGCVILLLHRPYSSIRNQSFDSCQH